MGFPYAILICGRGVPVGLLQKDLDGIIFTGFVDQMPEYLLGTDTFINPVLHGGGIKTKLVEALGYGLRAVSTVTGALGIDPDICSGKLQLVADNDWEAFAKEVVTGRHEDEPQGPQYYARFFWGAIAARAASALP